MPVKRIAWLSVGLAACPSAFGQSTDDLPDPARGGWYLASSIGASDSLNYEYGTVEIPDILETTFHGVTRAGLTLEEGIGYAFAQGLRVEAAAAFGYFDGAKTNVTIRFDAGRPGGPDIIEFPVKGTQSRITSLHLNGYYDIGRSESFRPYIGAGAGLASVEIDDGSVIDAEDTALSLQVMGGFSTRLSKSASLFVEARWQSLSDLSFRVFSLPTSLPLGADFEISQASLRSGLRFAF